MKVTVERWGEARSPHSAGIATRLLALDVEEEEGDGESPQAPVETLHHWKYILCPGISDICTTFKRHQKMCFFWYVSSSVRIGASPEQCVILMIVRCRVCKALEVLFLPSRSITMNRTPLHVC